MSGKRGSWHIDHGRSLDDDGSNHLRNMWALCAKHNLDKSTENGTQYDAQFERATFKGKVIDVVNKNLLDGFYKGYTGIDNSKERRIKKR